VDVPSYYPYLTRRVLHLFDEGVLTRVSSIDVEPNYGYVARINYDNGSHRVTYGNDLGLNVGAACELAKDKGHSKFMLKVLDISVPEGAEFLLPTWAERVKRSPRQAANANIRETTDAVRYVEGRFGYPVFVKPIDGSKGAGISEVHDRAELLAAFEGLEEKKVRVVLVEEPIRLPDYRVVTLDGELISAYRRTPLAVVGDGAKTIAQLVDSLQQRYIEEGRDTRLFVDDERIATHLTKQGLSLESKLLSGRRAALLPISNLSAGGTSDDVSDVVHPHWVALAGDIARNFNLRLSGLDIACADISRPDSAYYVFELNAAPGLDHYALSGAAQRQVVDDLYARVLNVCM
jgi:D-alanine-D-alanine ligase-like ATP-grasp enzyme